MKIFKSIISIIILALSIFLFLWILDVNNIANIDFGFINNSKFGMDIIDTKLKNEVYFNISFYVLLSLLFLTSIFGFVSISKKRESRKLSLIFMWMLLVVSLSLIIFGIILISI